jgi:hypothetical protein
MSFISGATAQRGPRPPHSWSHTVTPRSVGLVAETFALEHNTYKTQISMPTVGIRTRKPSKRTADDRLRQLGYWDRRFK